MDVLQIDLASRKQVRDFHELPFRLYREIPQWVPPLEGDARLMLDPKRHPFYRHSEAAFFIAYRDGLPRGRLAVLDNRPYNDYNHSRSAFFYLFESENDPEVAAQLFEAGCAWAREHGLTEIIGPKGFTLLDGLGMLVKGFEQRPAFGLPIIPSSSKSLVSKPGVKSSAAISAPPCNSPKKSTNFPPASSSVADCVLPVTKHAPTCAPWRRT